MTHAFASHKGIVLLALIVFATATFLLFAATGATEPFQMPVPACPPNC